MVLCGSLGCGFMPDVVMSFVVGQEKTNVTVTSTNRLWGGAWGIRHHTGPNQTKHTPVMAQVALACRTVCLLVCLFALFVCLLGCVSNWWYVCTSRDPSWRTWQRMIVFS